mmetsp:Transcript_32451/g.82862  ORF Transcript_32451/g.82862 Transcript_32451/m.82862 type:complete len:206 (-) Transcript_32451:468-1085(-)
MCWLVCLMHLTGRERCMLFSGVRRILRLERCCLLGSSTRVLSCPMTGVSSAGGPTVRANLGLVTRKRVVMRPMRWGSTSRMCLLVLDVRRCLCLLDRHFLVHFLTTALSSAGGRMRMDSLVLETRRRGGMIPARWVLSFLLSILERAEARCLLHLAPLTLVRCLMMSLSSAGGAMGMGSLGLGMLTSVELEVLRWGTIFRPWMLV